MACWWSAPRTPREFMTSHAPASVTEACVFYFRCTFRLVYSRERERERQTGRDGGRERERQKERERERGREGERKVHVVDSIISSVIMRFKKPSGIPSTTTSCCKPLVPVNGSAWKTRTPIIQESHSPPHPPSFPITSTVECNSHPYPL